MNQVKILSHTHKSATQGAALAIIKKTLCAQKNGDCFCSTCFSISQKTHPKVIWISSKTSYTKDDLGPLHGLTQLARTTQDQLFFVLENPEFLLPAAANSLLKTLEEPPPNTTFLFLSQNTLGILPTILSRAELISVTAPNAEGTINLHPLIPLVLAACRKKEIKPSQIEAILQKDCPDAQTSALLVDDIIQSLSKENDMLEYVELLYTLRATPPAQGSSKLFWRTVFMKLGLL